MLDFLHPIRNVHSLNCTESTLMSVLNIILTFLLEESRWFWVLHGHGVDVLGSESWKRISPTCKRLL